MSQPNDQERPLLGITGERIQLDNARAVRDTCVDMARQARRELLLFERGLDPALYDQPGFLEAVRRLALARTDLSIRVLIFDPRESVKSAPQFLELARRLTSRIAIRCVSEDDRERLDAFLVADERGYVRRGLADTLEAIADFNNPLTARQLRNDFNPLWEKGTIESELRRLFI